MLDKLRQHVDISEFSNFRTPSMARYFFEFQDISELGQLQEILHYCYIKEIPYLIIGGGTNMLFAFDEYPGVVIINRYKGWSYDDATSLLEASSAENISDIATILEREDDQYLWHRFIGLPGTIGGAVYGNAGCFGLETENNFVSAEVIYIPARETRILQKQDMDFSYRSSLLKEHPGEYFLLRVTFDLSQKIEKYASDIDNIYFREHKQPKGNTCGSFFKNPSREQSAGYLIEQVGLKGVKLGGAFFSEKHANFLMSDGSATYEDLLQLIEEAQHRVQETFSVSLVPEVRIISFPH